MPETTPPAGDMDFPIDRSAAVATEECILMDVDEVKESKQLITEKLKLKKSVNCPEEAEKNRLIRQMRKMKQMVLSLTKPSYVLGLGYPKVRADNRSKLYTMLRKLVRQQNWKELSGVLSLVLKGTMKDMHPWNNRLKYLAAMELVKQFKQDREKDIEDIFNAWMKRFKQATGSSYDESIALQVEFILYLVTIGDRSSADIAAKDLIQMRKYDRNPLSHLVLGLTYYESWYSTLPEEERLTKIDHLDAPVESNNFGAGSDNLIRYSVGHSVAANNESENQYHYDSETSVRVDKKILRETSGSQCQGRSADDAHISGGEMASRSSKKPQAFFVDSEPENSEDDEAADYEMDHTSIFFAQGLDSWLFPFKLPAQRGYKEFSRFKRRVDHKDYRRAVEHLRLALHATPPVIAALVPLVQLLLLGDQVGKALLELEKLSSDSGQALAFRLKASIMEHFDPCNYADQISCYECLLEKDPTCSHALRMLISLHREGEYDPESLIEMIALHLDVTYGENHFWKEFAICFLELSRVEEDRLSVRQNGDEHQQMQEVTLRIPKIFKDPKLANSWIFRCKWWLNRHFGKKTGREEIAAGNSELLAYKAACSSHMYGREFEYVQNVHNLLEQNEETELLHFLQMHMQHSFGFYSNVYRKPRR